jgi:hypothetical protein
MFRALSHTSRAALRQAGGNERIQNTPCSHHIFGKVTDSTFSHHLPSGQQINRTTLSSTTELHPQDNFRRSSSHMDLQSPAFSKKRGREIAISDLVIRIPVLLEHDKADTLLNLCSTAQTHVGQSF